MTTLSGKNGAGGAASGGGAATGASADGGTGGAGGTRGAGHVPPVLVDAVAVCAFLFTAFGSTLSRIAPPAESKPEFAIGMASFLTLGILLFTRAVARGSPAGAHRRRWLMVAGVALVLSVPAWLTYMNYFDKLTFPYPDASSVNRMIAGTVLTPRGQAGMTRDSSSYTELVLGVGPRNRHLIWEASSIRRSELMLSSMYATLVVLVAIMVFSAVEGLLSTDAPTQSNGGGK